MSEPAVLDFQEILAHPTLAYAEGLRFFRGKGLMNDALRRLADDLDSRGISYCVVGAVALGQHGYLRFTSDIDLLLTREGLDRFHRELVGRGYRPAFEGAVRTFRSAAEGVPVEVLTAGDFPGDGRPKPVVFPDPATCFTVIDGIRTLPLERLIELKLASGTTPGRRRDLADVQELIRIRDLDASYAAKLDPSVRGLFQELCDELLAAQANEQAPDRDPREAPGAE